MEAMVLNGDVLVPVGVAGGLAVSGLFALRWLDAQFTELRQEIRSLKASAEHLASDRWTRTDQRLFEMELRVHNPSLQFPRREESEG